MTGGDGDFDGIIDEQIPGSASTKSEVQKLGSNSDFTFTQVDWLDGVTTFDIVRVIQHILGTVPLENGYKQVAADVNNTGTVTTFDALLIRQLILGNTQTFEAFEQPWRFIPEFFTEGPSSAHFDGGNDDNPFSITNFDPIMEGTKTYPLATGRQGFDAVKLGDVNGSNSEAITGQNPPNEGNPVYIDIVKTVENGQAYFDFKVEDFEDIIAYQFDIEFEHLYIDYAESLMRDLEEFNPDFFGTTRIDEGIIKTIWLDEVNADASSLDDLEEIFRLVFEGDVTNAGAMVNITNEIGFRSNDEYNRPLRNFAYSSDGTIRPIIQKEYREGNIASFSAQPNPFTGSFELLVEALKDGPTDVQMFNSVGQLVHAQKESLRKGANRIEISNLGHLSVGIYFVQMESDGFSVTKKVMKQ